MSVPKEFFIGLAWATAFSIPLWILIVWVAKMLLHS